MLTYKDNIMRCRITKSGVEIAFFECNISSLQDATHIKSIIELFLRKQLYHETFKQAGHELEFKTKFIKINDFYRPFMQIDLKTHEHNVCFTVSLRQAYQLNDILKKCIVNMKP